MGYCGGGEAGETNYLYYTSLLYITRCKIQETGYRRIKGYAGYRLKEDTCLILRNKGKYRIRGIQVYHRKIK